MKNRFSTTFYFVTLLILPFTAFSPVLADSHIERGGTLIFGRGGDSIGLDPAHEVDGESFKVCENIYDTLIQYKDGSTELEPALATSWESSEDGLTWTFYLRQGVIFHDGTTFNAEMIDIHSIR